MLSLNFDIFFKHSGLHSVPEMGFVVKKCGILHKMIAVQRGNAKTLNFCNIIEREGSYRKISLEEMLRPECCYEQAAQWQAHLDIHEDTSDHKKITDAHTNLIWGTAGNKYVQNVKVHFSLLRNIKKERKQQD